MSVCPSGQDFAKREQCVSSVIPISSFGMIEICQLGSKFEYKACLTHLLGVGLVSSRVSGGRACVCVGYIWKGRSRRRKSAARVGMHPEERAQLPSSHSAFERRGYVSVRVRPSATFLPFGVNDDVSSSLNREGR